MKLKACYWVPTVALLAAAPAWANYSWGQIGQFRPGIQLGIAVLVLVTEVLVIKPLVRMSWGVTTAAVVGANLLSAILGFFFVYDINFTHVGELVAAAIPTTVIEFMVVASVAEKHSGRPRYRAHWAFVAVFAANLLSALVTFGYLYANYRGHEQPLSRVERARMGSAAHQIAEACRSGHEAGTLELLPRLISMRKLPAPIDLAPSWLPWARMRLTPRYESAIPKRLDPPGKGRPMVWTGAPYLAGERGVIFTDGRFEMMSERAFRQLGAVPSPPQITLPPLGSTP